jgi:hypothetical protein
MINNHTFILSNFIGNGGFDLVKFYDKGGALAGVAFAPDFAFHEVHVFFYDGETQSGRALSGSGAGAQLLVLSEYLLHIFLANAWPFIGNLYPEFFTFTIQVDIYIFPNRRETEVLAFLQPARSTESG